MFDAHAIPSTPPGRESVTGLARFAQKSARSPQQKVQFEIGGAWNGLC
jgi:hypothetical protein